MATGNSPWDKYTLLSLDGGGIRGFASMLLLEKLMDHVRTVEQDPEFLNELREMNPTVNVEVAPSSFHPHGCPIQNHNYAGNLFLPCHYFDCIIGTSTGGLIATMLGRLRMTVTLVKEQYEQLGDEIFGSPRWFHYHMAPLPFPRNKFDYQNLEKVVRRIVGKFDSRPNSRHGFPNPAFCKTDDDLCKTIVTAYGTVRNPDTGALLEDGTYFFQTYDTTRRALPEEVVSEGNAPGATIPEGTPNPGFSYPGPIWEVARASTAALTYFDPCDITAFNGNVWRFHDAGMLEANNPTQDGFAELQSWGPHHNYDAFDAVVSIGTGSYPVHRTVAKRAGGIKEIINIIYYSGFAVRGNAEVVHKKVNQRLSDLEQRIYWRFNDINAEWEGIPLDAWENDFSNGVKVNGGKTLGKMRRLINAYLGGDGVQGELRECAKRLVKHRRLRHAADYNRWERFALATVYKCDRCFRKFATKDELVLHFQAKQIPVPDNMDPYRHCWNYTF
ncbi:acyl transferase/acyl hydrolase/lysophospholipase [Aspergillus pseudocaelatus]|uniref:Acyl transferase/acyl hydrolase/lysophospholipase n=1 Tax=Aspergillus pseudocaelatus TaxID=1825620 RepID=A0ABQ6WUN0_9EURO|nr:acyl transferase/acyl hydrolase/lysophospholipase [Aspergillus pseudocaelatus]